MDIITENKNFHFNTVISNINMSFLSKSSSLSELDVMSNIYRILDEQNNTIGYASLSDVGGTGLLVDGFIRYDIPERLNIETEGLFLNVHFSDNLVKHLSIDSQGSKYGAKITIENQITVEE
jgi:hypothetical protein